VTKRKLIEVALPLEAINRESAREKSIRHGHPSTLHLWWARRPLAAARAVLFSQLVDDPSSRPEEFPTEEAQRAERERLHQLIERLVVWENVGDERLLATAHAEILRSADGKPPLILDPFAGGGTIPLEAQRLGLEAHASDLNPVPVLINKALVEIPPKFVGRAPVFPGAASSRLGQWDRVSGLAEDVVRYGMWMRDRAEERIGSSYPKAILADGSAAAVIAWIWARTVKCPNPACGIQMPLVRSWWVGKKKGREAFLRPRVIPDATTPSGKRVAFSVETDLRDLPDRVNEGTVGRTGAACVSCAASVPLSYIRSEGRARRLGEQLMAVVAEGDRRRVYLEPAPEQVAAGQMVRPTDSVDGSLGYYPRDLKAPTYGLTEFADLFTARQLWALTTFSDLVAEARARVLSDGLAGGLEAGAPLAEGGSGAAAYADAVSVYLSMTVSRLADLGNSLCRWEPNAECPRQLFGRQAIPMVWDFAEGNPLGNSSGSWKVLLDGARRAFASPAFARGDVAAGSVRQADAAARDYSGFVISTDPPYYDNIGYSDLSDFFYVWLRRSLRTVMPTLFSTMLVPKSDELVANAYRHGGSSGAEEFFETGFRNVFARVREDASTEYPISVYYAFKQSESSADGEASTGWETLLEGMIRTGWEITSTWPLRTETSSRMQAQGQNALASSIVLTVRPRPLASPTTDRRGFIAALEAELPDALRKLQQGAIAPVDLPQAAIGPGMAVFSRYSGVLEADGTKMSVRSALARINEILDAVLSEQEGDYRPDTRFAITWYRLHGFGAGKSGEAENVATARAVVLGDLARSGILTYRGGVVQLISPSHLNKYYDPVTDQHISTWEVLHHMIKVLERDGIAPAGDLLRAALDRPAADIDADELKELAHLLFRIAESNGWTKDALSFNTLVTSWPEIIEVARSTPVAAGPAQGAFSFDEDY
jgi:putative DNA methylase